MASVERQEVKKWAQDRAPIVQGQGLEKESNPDKKQDFIQGTKEHTHDGDSIKSSNEVEEGAPTSLFQNLKGSLLGSTAIAEEDIPPGYSGPTPEEEKKGFGSDELGTGYEEDTERGALTSDSSDMSDMEGIPSRPKSLFKPVQEKNESETTLEDLRASKLNQNTDPENIQAPGIFGRAKEEIDAISDELLGAMRLKEKPRPQSAVQSPTGNTGGFFSKMAEKIGFGEGHGRSQSQ